MGDKYIYIDRERERERERERQTDRDRQTKPFELRQICMWVQVNSLGDVCNAANPSMALAVLEAAFVTNAMQGHCRGMPHESLKSTTEDTP